MISEERIVSSPSANAVPAMSVRSDAVVWRLIASTSLKRAVTTWFLTAVAGQWLFVFYLLAFYGSLVLGGGLPGLAVSGRPGGYIPGDVLGNLTVAAHLLSAVIVMGGGPLQLVPQIRTHLPGFHRWSGRLYLPTVVMTALGGLYLTWAREGSGSVVNRLGISVDAVLIVAFAAIALHYALKCDFSRHRRWALRLFMAVSAVWFFRIGLMLWVHLTGGIGIDFATFTGPFIGFWHFGQYVVPLTVLELYFLARARGSSRAKLAMAALLVGLTVLMALGIYRAWLGLWLPRI